MRIKRLEIQGFKSFKDKTVIYFDDGITGIVGPNGCGKSNIVDAFFWVMGEQSYKHMRGHGSDDLIFNGSTKYTPLGMAEATLVLATDAEESEPPAGATVQDVPIHLRSKEVSVTRRLYRGGEGEYFINGIPARLKDIHELFMDTGVGAKGYSVVEQGQIGKVVNSKPEERRLLVEEAAGIAKYKARKKESLRKIEATTANLARLTDVVQEIERNLGSLERQAQKARQYKKYKEELLDKEMTWGRRRNKVLIQKLNEFQIKKSTSDHELTGMKAELQTSENFIEVERVAQVTDAKSAEELQNRIQNLSDALTMKKSALDLSKKRQGDLISRKQLLRAEKEELEAAIETESKRLKEYESEAQNIDQIFSEAAQKAQTQDELARKVRQEMEFSRKELDSAKKQMMDGVTLSSELTSKSASLASRIESAQTQAARLKTQLDVEDQGKDVQELKAEVSRLRQAIQDLERQARNLQTQDEENLQILTEHRSHLQSMEKLALAQEGLGAGAKAALDWAKSKELSGHLSALVDTLEVQPGYETSTETYLAQHLDSLLASTPDVAMNAIHEIQNSQKGRVSIHLPRITSAQSHVKESSDDLNPYFKVLGSLSDFVKAKSALVDDLIQGVFVVETFEGVLDFLKNAGAAALHGRSLVSLAGEVLSAQGVLTGGSSESENSLNAIRINQKITELRGLIASAEKKYDQSHVEYKSSLEKLENTKQRLVRTQFVSHELSSLNQEEQNAVGELQSIEGKILQIVNARSVLETKITQLEADLVVHETESRVQESELQNFRVQEASLRERNQSLKRELQSIRSLVTDRQKRLEEIQQFLVKAEIEQQEFTGGESQLEVEIEELVQSLGRVREELSAVKDKIENSNSKLNDAHERNKELHKQIEEKNAELSQLALEIEKVNSDRAHLIQSLEEKYGKDCLEHIQTSPTQEEMTEPVITAAMSEEEERLLGEEVERLRERIRRLGEVNVMAVDEYEELKKRYDYLLNEKSDLEKSIQNLQDAIEHINKTSEDRFRKAFEAIGDRFEKLFPVVFGGGQAKLSLVYPEGSSDILEAGVDILAQPPGKKVSNITLLSGGEKALTAVCLIFAIFMVKPSPFCVLDEVDAPLDDANIGKFNAILKEMARKSQFILITHNKKTMELNDVLYGVTMEEPGVSKMVSIQMH